MNTPILLLGAYAAGAASGVGATWLCLRAKPAEPIPSDWMPRALEFNKAVRAEIKQRAEPGKPYVTGLRSPFAPKPRASHWREDAVLDALEPSRSKIERPTPSGLPSVGWGADKSDAQ